MNFPLSLQSRYCPTQSTFTSLPFDSPHYPFALEDPHSFNDPQRSSTFEDPHMKSKAFEGSLDMREQASYSLSSKHRASEEGHSFNELPKPKTTDDNHSLLKYLVLENFKVSPCSIKVQHNHKQCQFYHYPKDRKRVGDFYSAELCEYIENNQPCPQGDKCLKSHSCVEQLYRADKYKTKFCSQYPYNTDNCEYGEFCSFAHHEEEILIELLHRLEKNDDFFMFKFKTVMCPFSSLPHDKAQCVYSHNWQDFRRKPNLFNYSPVSCSNWKFNNYIVNYSDGCPMSGTCDKCHGWKELDYHPLVYKTKPCANGVNCHRTFECPFYHCEAEKRTIDHKIQTNVFRYAPKNRMAALKKKSEPVVTTTNNPSFQNKLRKITSTDASNTTSPGLHPSKPSLWSMENNQNTKVSPMKFESFTKTPRKTEELFAANVTFSKFYPELANDFKILSLKDNKNTERTAKPLVLNFGSEGCTLLESNLSTKSHSSTESSLDLPYIC